jgi:hypothetical protein
MNRTPPRRATSVQPETPPTRAEREPPPPEAPSSGPGWGWRIALVVWVAGFLGLAAVELGHLAWRLLRG